MKEKTTKGRSTVKITRIDVIKDFVLMLRPFGFVSFIMLPPKKIDFISSFKQAESENDGLTFRGFRVKISVCFIMEE